jgi:hypothetical protein
MIAQQPDNQHPFDEAGAEVIDLIPRDGRQTTGGHQWIAETFPSAMFPEDSVTVSVELCPATGSLPERRGVRIVARNDEDDHYGDGPADPLVVVLDWETGQRLALHILQSIDELRAEGGAR